MSEAVTIAVKIIPGARRNEVVGWETGEWRIRVTAPPVEGKANKALMEFLVDVLGIAKNRIRLLKGEKSRHKVISIEGLDAEAIRTRLAPAH
jgi:uncharacterized protein (TIGR00251 family)